MHVLLLGAVISALSTAPSGASPDLRSLSGRVTDSTGAPVSDARVVVIEVNRATTTDEEGRYAISDLPAGTFGVSFSAVGFAPQVRRVVVAQGDVVVNVTLKHSLIELPTLQTTASPIATTSLNSPQPTSVLSGEQLAASTSSTLGETISILPGVRSFSTGNGIGKPVIRGLTSNRVVILDDGQRMETAQWGDEHGPQLESADAERVEVIRGPASVLYGSDAIGGVVNVVQPALPDAIGGRPFVGGTVSAGFASNGLGPEGTITVSGASGHVGFRGTYTGHDKRDVKTPAATLPNSGSNAFNIGGTGGYRGGWGSVQATYVHREEEVEIHEDPAEEPDATPFQKIGEDRARITTQLPAGSSHFDVDVGFERNRRREFEEAGAADVALGLLTTSWTGDLRFHHSPLGPFAGILGVSGLRSELEKFGEESLVPEHRSGDLGLYLFEQVETGRWSFSLAGRYDYRNLDVDEDPDLGVNAQERTYNSVTGSLGALYRLAEPVALVLNLGRGFRAPTAYDLFANGVHEGTVRFERGDSTLDVETSFNTDLALRVQTNRMSFEVGGFANFINDFIYPDPTGDFDPESGFQIFQITQGDAELYGFEGAVEWHATPVLHFRATGDYVHGQNTTIDQPLAFMPPFRATYGVRVEAPDHGILVAPYLSLSGESNSKQTRADPEDFAPDGYTLAHAGIGTGFRSGEQVIRLDLQARNLFDTTYRNFLSRYKTYADDPGRNVIVRVSTDF